MGGNVMAQKYTSTYYEARQLTGSGRIADTWETLKDAKKGIDKSNARAVKNGYPAEQYLITKTVSETEWTDKMKFKGRRVTETPVQTYPKEIVS
jgi:hypothetical protein